MKKLLLMVLVIQCFFKLPALAQQSQLKPADINIEGLSGKVKKVEEENAALKMRNGVLSEVERHHSRTFIFDREGRLTYEWRQISNLSPFEQNYYYDKKGNRHRRTSRINQFSVEQNKIGRDQLALGVFRYDSSANILFEDVYRGDEIIADFLHQKYKSTFDTSGRIIEKLTLTVKDEVVFKDVYIYGAERLPTEKHLSMPGNPVEQIFKYNYTLDSKGNWTKQTAEITLAGKAAEPRTEITYRKISYYN